MNSKQRRQAYRAMPKTGAVVRWKSAITGKVREGVMVGPSDIYTNEHPNAFETRATPSTHRVAVRMAGGSTCHILVSNLFR
ncbi:hypothetical protein [Pseudomonas aeruginosa]|uniref:hypothetical protein n=1 Tax=Pseudomonas aeruginosa TaxID=287 RepID=UPI00021201C9|nr:hypothetical protein [Pseudomonas aeruginosa]DBA08870.1 TPA_asm: hypothetical protein [Pseudomonas phage vB_PaeS-D14P]EKT8051196.1 hypothetical protein [Pseudomonas aeruginosa]ELH4224840.1 hypothetical protein [Pseudomonas aeruginosa]EME92765.1 hypothetical protein H123_18260 [Pseudomonas aeruginosa PA21_ST175]ERF07298.1 hypothetical protein PA13_1014335 [Pseudomonas aeruginosa HB13]